MLLCGTLVYIRFRNVVLEANVRAALAIPPDPSETHIRGAGHSSDRGRQVRGGVLLTGDGQGGDGTPADARSAVLRRAAEVKGEALREQRVAEGVRPLLEQAEAAYAAGEHDLAVRIYESHLERMPGDFVAMNNMGVVKDAKGDHRGAIACYQRAVQANPQYHVAWTNMGNSHAFLGEAEQAAKAYRQAIVINRKYRLAYDHLVQMLKKDHPPRQVVEHLRRISAEVGESAYLWYHESLLWEELKRPARAVKAIDRALGLDRDDPEVWKVKGNLHFQLEEYDLAVTAYDEALTRDMRNAEVWNNRGFTFLTAGFYDVAITCYRQALRLDPRYKAAWYNLGYTYHLLDRLDEGITAYERAIALDPKDAVLLNNRGNAEYNLGNYIASIPWFEKAVEVDPDYDIAWNNIGNALNRAGRDEEALAYHDKALAINAKFDYAMYAKGESYHALGDQEEALRWVDRSLELNPNYDHAWLLKAEVLRELGRSDEALEAVENAVRLNDDFNEAHFLRGELLESLGRPREARRAYEDALAAATRGLRRSPAQGRLWERKGAMLSELGDYADAVGAYDTALMMPRTSIRARGSRADVLMRAHRYREAIESLSSLEPDEIDDPIDMRLRTAEALAELGRVDDVRKEVGDLLRPAGAEGEGLVEVLLDLDDAVAGTGGEAGEGAKGAGEGKASKGSKEGEAKDVDELVPYRPKERPPREPGDVDRARAHHALGRALYVAGDAAAAVEELRAAAKVRPDVDGLQRDLGIALRDLGDHRAAAEAFQLAAGHALDDESPRGLLGMSLLDAGDVRAADRAFDEAIGVAPGYALAWLGKGLVMMRRDRPKKAVRYLTEAARLDPRLPDVRLALSRALEAVGDREGAVREARRALTADPERAEAVEMLERLGAPPAPGAAAGGEGLTSAPPATTPAGVPDLPGGDMAWEEAPPPDKGA